MQERNKQEQLNTYFGSSISEVISYLLSCLVDVFVRVDLNKITVHHVSTGS